MAEKLPFSTAQLIVCFKQDVKVQPDVQNVLSSTSHDVTSIQECLKTHNARCETLFGPNPERVQERQTETLKAATAEGLYEHYEHPLSNIPSLSCFYRVHCANENLAKLVEELGKDEHVDAAYLKPPTSLPLGFPAQATAATPAPSTTPNYIDRQGYLNPAPTGIDAKISWVLPGGGGAGVKVIDCEHGWNLSHEDLLLNQGGVVAGTQTTNPDYINHGTAVFGEISGDRNDIGITGIAPDSIISASSWATEATSTAIRSAADKLSPGDIILLEGHRSGPRAPNPSVGDLGRIAIEWWPDDLLAIRYAVGKGIIVVAAAGNGDENLDDPAYDTPDGWFPSWWKNPFNRNNPPSGSLIVGAGQPPPGTHGRQTLADRSRCHYNNWWGSNYSRLVDAQGWGVEVTTTGYGDLQTGASESVWYADGFSGTSSASPMVVGALLCIQGVLKARGRRPLTPQEAKQLLRTCAGTPQQADTDTPVTQRIGKRPNLRKLIPAAARWKCRSGRWDVSGQACIFLTNSLGVGLLRQSGNAMTSVVNIPNGQMLAGGWRINSADNIYGPVGAFSSPGKTETLSISPWGIGIIRCTSGTLEAYSVTPNGTRLGDWLLNTRDNNFGPAADFTGNSTSSIIVTSPWGLGILQASGGGSILKPILMAPNGTRFGSTWLLNTADNDFSCVGAFKASSKPKRQILAVSPWGIGVLEYNASTRTLDVLDAKPNGTRLGEWLLNTADNRFGPVGDFDGDGADEVLVTSPWGVGLLKLVSGGGGTDGLTVTLARPNGTRFGEWLLNTADDSFGPAADYDGDGRAELLVTSPWGVAVLKQEAQTMRTVAMHANGSRLGGWLLNMENDCLGQAADFDNDSKAEILVTSPWGLGVLELRADGTGLGSAVMVPNGTMAGGWKIDTAADDYGDGW